MSFWISSSNNAGISKIYAENKWHYTPWHLPNNVIINGIYSWNGVQTLCKVTPKLQRMQICPNNNLSGYNFAGSMCGHQVLPVCICTLFIFHFFISPPHCFSKWPFYVRWPHSSSCPTSEKKPLAVLPSFNEVQTSITMQATHIKQREIFITLLKTIELRYTQIHWFYKRSTSQKTVRSMGKNW